MKRNWALAGVATLLLSACASGPSASGLPTLTPPVVIDTECTTAATALTAPTPHLPATGVDVAGAALQVDKVERIVTISAGAGEIVWALGMGDHLVGDDLASLFPGSDQLTIVNPGHEVSVETVLSLTPDVVIADVSSDNKRAVKALTKAGVPVVAIPLSSSLDDVAARVRAVATALGVADAGEQLVAQMDEQIAQVVATRTRDVKIAFLYLRGSAGVYLLGGKGSGADSLIAALGATDVGTSLGVEGFGPLTAEALAAADPQAILIMNGGLESVGGLDKMLAMPGISSTTAAKNRAVLQADDRVLLSFGPQTPEVIKCLATQLDEVAKTAS